MRYNTVSCQRFLYNQVVGDIFPQKSAKNVYTVAITFKGHSY